MELKDFLKDTITQISEAISDLNNQDSEIKIIVNPTNNNSLGMINKNGCEYKQTSLHFQIALTVIESGTSGGKVGVFTGWLGASAKSEQQNHSQSATSVDFHLDVLLPQG